MLFFIYWFVFFLVDFTLAVALYIAFIVLGEGGASFVYILSFISILFNSIFTIIGHLHNTSNPVMKAFCMIMYPVLTALYM